MEDVRKLFVNHSLHRANLSINSVTSQFTRNINYKTKDIAAKALQLFNVFYAAAPTECGWLLAEAVLKRSKRTILHLTKVRM